MYMYLSVCLLLRNPPLISFIPGKQGIIGFFMVFSSCGFAENTFLRVMASFAGHHRLPHSLVSLRWTKEIANGFFFLITCSMQHTFLWLLLWFLLTLICLYVRNLQCSGPLDIQLLSSCTWAEGFCTI